MENHQTKPLEEYDTNELCDIVEMLWERYQTIPAERYRISKGYTKIAKLVNDRLKRKFYRTSVVVEGEEDPEEEIETKSKAITIRFFPKKMVR